MEKQKAIIQEYKDKPEEKTEKIKIINAFIFRKKKIRREYAYQMG